VGEREAEGETEGEAGDEWQRGRRGRGGGSKAGMPVLGARWFKKKMSLAHVGEGGEGRRGRGAHPL